MSKHLLTCVCGRQWPVQSSQAGEQITCKCGASVDVPTLRGLAELPTVEEVAISPGGWTKAKGLCFVGAIAWGVVGAAITWWLWSQAGRPVDLPIFDQKAEEFSARTSQLSPSESLTYWRMYRDMPDEMLTGPQRIEAAATRNSRARWFVWVAGLMTVVGCVGAMLGTFLLRQAPPSAPRTTKPHSSRA